MKDENYVWIFDYGRLHDDSHKVCNKKYSNLLGYKSPKAWADAEAPLSNVVEEDQQKVIDAYMNALRERHCRFC